MNRQAIQLKIRSVLNARGRSQAEAARIVASLITDRDAAEATPQQWAEKLAERIRGYNDGA